MMVKKKSVKKKAKRAEVNKEQVRMPSLKNERDIAFDFAVKVHKKFDHLIKASILFGSQAKDKATQDSDIDIILIIDDAAIQWDMELIAWYREELGKLIAEQSYNKELHINTVKLTTWWDDLIEGDPVVLNIVRYGQTLVDSGGFFAPLKALLVQGKIRATPEAVYNALQRATTHLARSKISLLNSIEGVYWTMIDSAQAALITAGHMPPSPEHVPHYLYTTFVEKKMIKQERVEQLKQIFFLHKQILHQKIKEVKGSDIERWQSIAEDFLIDMTNVIDKILESNRESTG